MENMTQCYRELKVPQTERTGAEVVIDGGQNVPYLFRRSALIVSCKVDTNRKRLEPLLYLLALQISFSRASAISASTIDIF